MGLPTAAARAFDTKVVSAAHTQLAFSSALDDGAFTAAGAAEWVAASRHELRANRCVALPTETVYGLAANALDARAVQAIYAAKGRPSDNPLIVYVSSMRMLRALYHLPACDAGSPLPFLGTANAALEGARLQAQLLQAEADDRARGGDGVWPEIPRVYHAAIRRFWPGALTLVLPRPPCIPMQVLGGHGVTVAVRFPSHPVARAAISACGLPLAAPSANTSGRPSPTLAAHVVHDLAGRLPLVVDAGACDVGVESTVLDACSPAAFVDGALAPCILRPGGVTYEQLRALGGPYARLRVYRRDFTSAEIEANPTTPGMKYRHYSPSAPVRLFVPGSDPAQLRRRMQDALAGCAGKRVGVVTVGNARLVAAPGTRLVAHAVDDARDMARRIFALLRALDDAGVDVILVQGVDEADEGLAVMNRLAKAASEHTVC
ncbi:hypothetical protein LPJ63_004344 [Coemansia sp. RSA 2711]|nr:hypothetical protein LPJ63_004344 [Coemansia sp. RSA 2711]